MCQLFIYPNIANFGLNFLIVYFMCTGNDSKYCGLSTGTGESLVVVFADHDHVCAFLLHR